MQPYQLTLLVKNEMPEGDRKSLFDSISKDFGEMTKEDLWGVKGLAYPIEHQSQAYYAHFEFNCEPNVIPTLDKKLKLNEDIIRYLLTKIVIRADKPERIKKEKKAEKSEVEEKEEAANKDKE